MWSSLSWPKQECDQVYQWLTTGQWFSLVSSTNKTDFHDITEILLKVALSSITLNIKQYGQSRL